ncbi:elongation factor 1-delta-like [Malus sylvestris]|uniref:elongation factor 1-delta-like n=1 Tax=Malus sylvestris TaxID=3752 RepID=UPI0021ABB841|nr:elongation factor 1-delta-like [Malus sylvestris]
MRDFIIISRFTEKGSCWKYSNFFFVVPFSTWIFSYITGSQASKDDLTVHAALSKPPSPEFVNVSRWYNHIAALFSAVFGEGSGVIIETGDAASTYTPPVAETKAADDVDLFGEEFVDVDLEETKGEKKVAEERVAAFVKAYTEKKEYGKSSVLLDVTTTK